MGPMGTSCFELFAGPPTLFFPAVRREHSGISWTLADLQRDQKIYRCFIAENTMKGEDEALVTTSHVKKYPPYHAKITLLLKDFCDPMSEAFSNFQK